MEKVGNFIPDLDNSRSNEEELYSEFYDAYETIKPIPSIRPCCPHICMVIKCGETEHMVIADIPDCLGSQ